MLKVKTVKVQESPSINMLADTPDRILEIWKKEVETSSWFDPEKEHMVAFLVNTKLKLKGWALVSIGTVNEAMAHPREIFRPAIAAAAYGIILAHNHPSGDPTPSEADRRMTQRITAGAELLMIRLLDHVIVGEKSESNYPYGLGYVSFRELGLI